MRLVLLFICTLLAKTGWSHAGGHNCFVRHLSEIISLNLERRDYYSLQSDGKSKGVSDALIWSERLTWASAKWFDWRAKYWQKNGIPLFCSEFISMDLTPGLSVSLTPREAPKASLNIIELIKTLRSSMQNRVVDLLGPVRLALREIEAEPNFHCMQRHLIESIGRTAMLAPVYEQMAKDRELKSPQALIRQFLKLQIWGLRLGKWLDSKALPLQIEGLGIICHDVPVIPLNIGIDPPLVLTRSTIDAVERASKEGQ